MRRLPEVLIEPVVRLALAEDLGRAGDVTAMACIPENARMKAAFAARKPGVLAGIDCVRQTFNDSKSRLDCGHGARNYRGTRNASGII